ncbi:head-tail joining protein, partial [Escherichia coli]|uniref:head-tail joining protein n=1 Tax=Escherichia coli TaxID=562 RepID=UPI002870B39B
MNRFRRLLTNADARVTRAFAEEIPAYLFLRGGEKRPVRVIFESPDATVGIRDGGEINADIFHVTHIGADEEGRTRVTLARGEPGRSTPAAPVRPSK